MPYCLINNCQVYYEWINERKNLNDATLVLLNTALSDSRTYGDQYKNFKGSDVALIAIDNTNSGRSTYRAEPLSTEEQINEITEIIHQQAISRPIWFAQSTAAGIGCIAASSIQTHGLILCAPILSCGIERRLKNYRSIILKSLQDETFREYCELVSFLTLGSAYSNRVNNFSIPFALKLRSLYTHKDYLKIWRQINERGDDDREVIEKISCPTLVITGREEMVQPLHLLENMLNRDHAKMVTLPCGHFLMSEAYGEVMSLILDFVSSIR